MPKLHSEVDLVYFDVFCTVGPLAWTSEWATVNSMERNSLFPSVQECKTCLISVFNAQWTRLCFQFPHYKWSDMGVSFTALLLCVVWLESPNYQNTFQHITESDTACSPFMCISPSGISFRGLFWGLRKEEQPLSSHPPSHHEQVLRKDFSLAACSAGDEWMEDEDGAL